jgi:putative thioredoxin
MTTATTPKQPSAAVFDVNEQSFEREVIQRSREVPVVVDLWAPWCGPCRTLGPLLERLAHEAKGAWVLAKLNVDENPRLAAMFKAQSIPAVKAIVNGKIAAEFVGAQPEPQVRAWLKRFAPEPAEPEPGLLETARALEASDPREAAARYRLLLGEEPDNAEALFNLGRLLLAQGELEGLHTLQQVPVGPFYTRAQAMLPLAEFFSLAHSGDEARLAAAVAQAPSDLEGRYQLAAHLARRQAHSEALDQLLAIVARDRTFRDDGARKTMLGLLEALGEANPLVAPYRRKLANTLF